MKFFERFLAQKFDLAEEIRNIDYLINYIPSFSTSIISVIKSNFFEWPLRRTNVTYEDFMKKTELDSLIGKAYKDNPNITIEEYLDIAEVVMSLLYHYYDKIKHIKTFHPLSENILSVTNSLNFKIQLIDYDENSKYAIYIPNDFKVSEAAEIVNDDNLAEKIYLYRHRTMSGNIYEKAIILSRLYMYFEGIRKTLEQNNFGSLCTTIGELSDKLKVRHKPKGYEELVVEEISENELEEAYDKLFDAYLSAIVLSQYIDDRDYLETLRKKFVKK